MIPLALGFAAELTFPLQPALVNGAMILAGQAAAFVQSIVYAFFLDVRSTDQDGTPLPADELLAKQQDRVWWTMFMMGIICCVAFALALFINEDLRRLRFGKTQVAAEIESPKSSTKLVQKFDLA